MDYFQSLPSISLTSNGSRALNVMDQEGLNGWHGILIQWNLIHEASETDMQSALSVRAGQWESPPDLKADLTALVTGETGSRHSLMNN